MKTCKDCLHYDGCHLEKTETRYEYGGCPAFTDKSEWVRLPCKVGDKAWYERKCPVCGKSIFITTSEWAYKRSNGGKAVRYMCSYSCLLKYDKEHPVKRRNR